MTSRRRGQRADCDDAGVADDVEELRINRELWEQVNALHTGVQAAEKWASREFTWGLFGIPEAQLGALGDVRGRAIAELGCGTAFVSAWLARMGARPVALDLSPAQLTTARRCQQTFGLHFPLVEADCARVPLASESFDVVVSEYGASVWCDPERWIAEAARVLRPGGRLAFLTNSVIVSMCVPAEGGYAETTLQRPQHAMGRVLWPGGGIEYHPSHGEWARMLTGNGFRIDALHELYAPPDASIPSFYDIAHPDWARSWPSEDLWVATLG